MERSGFHLPPEGPELEALIDALADRVAARLEARARVRSVAPAPRKRLLSQRDAAKLLGISRGRTLIPLIRSERIRTVKVNGTLRIPLSEIERVEREGLGKTRRQ